MRRIAGQAQRNGYRERRWDTRVGEIELAIPRLRTGSYLPSFLEPRRRAEQALVAVVQEAYVNGVSTRKVDRLVEQMGLRGSPRIRCRGCAAAWMSRSRLFRCRPLEGAYPYLWLDAKVERVRERGGVRQKALVIAYAVHESGVREVLGIDVGEAETEAFWTEFLFSLKARGLAGVRLCPLDAHQGRKRDRPRPRLPVAALHRALCRPRALCRLGLAESVGGGRIGLVGVGIIRALRGRRGACRVAGSGRAWCPVVWFGRALVL